MEQKRTLWIIATAGIFLLVVVGAALIFCRPFVKDPVISSVQQPVSPQASSDAWLNPVTVTEPTTPAEPLQPNDVTVISDTANVYSDTVTTIDLNALAAPNDITTVRDEAPVSVTAQGKSPAAAAVTKPVTTPAPAVEAVQPVKPKQQTAAPAAKKVTVTEYWVQAGAFSSREYAENAQDSISAYKIESEIFTKEVNGKIWYRVRMGPYKTETEADYWMTAIRSDPIFSEAYITEVKTQK